MQTKNQGNAGKMEKTKYIKFELSGRAYFLSQ